MPAEKSIQLVVLAPILTAAILLALRRFLPPWLASFVAITGLAISLYRTATLFFAPGGDQTGAASYTLASWIGTDLGLEFAFRVDALSMTWAIGLGAVGLLTQLYTVGHQRGAPDRTRTLSLQSLLIGAMLTLVLADNLALLFVGWEGVALLTMQLSRPTGGSGYPAGTPSRSAFITQRLGDAALLAAIVAIATQYGTLRIPELYEALRRDSGLSGSNATAPMLLVLAAAARSAQLPFLHWLKVARHAPAPAAALLHGAAVLPTGVFLLTRLWPLVAQSPLASSAVEVVGGTTALAAALLATRQRDARRVLAYLAAAQIGVMFLGLTVGAHAAVTHLALAQAVTVPLLFLGLGTASQALGDENDLMRFGGLGAALRGTRIPFLIGSLALAGLAPFAAFFAHRAVITRAWTGSDADFWLAVVAAIGLFVSAYATFRMYALIFTAEEPDAWPARPALVDGSWSMRAAQLGLAGLCVLGAALALPHFLPVEWLRFDLDDAFAAMGTDVRSAAAAAADRGAEVGISLAGIALTIGGARLGYLRYVDGPGAEREPAERGFGYALERDGFLSELWTLLVSAPSQALAHLAAAFERRFGGPVSERLENLLAELSGLVRVGERGPVHISVFWLIGGAAFLVLTLL